MGGEKFNLTHYLFEANLRVRPDQEALVALGEQGRRSWTYEQLYDRILAGSAFFNRSGQPGQRVLLRLPSGPEMAVGFFAAIHAGLIPIPLSPRLTEEEVAFLANDCAASLMIFDPRLPIPSPSHTPLLMGNHHASALSYRPGSLAPPGYSSPSTTQEDPAFLVYTSGTTGSPKGVLHAHRNVLGRIPMRKAWTGLRSEDRLLHAGELNWTYTIGVGLMDVWAAGGTSFVYEGPRDRPEIWTDLIEREEISIFASVPGLYRRIIKYSLTDSNAKLPSSFRHGLTAGDALSPALLEEWQQHAERPLFEALGMSEISTYISSSPEVPVKPGSPGKPQAGRRISLLHPETLNPLNGWGDTGLLAVHRSDPGLMLGYWNRPEEDQAVFNGDWFVGGDLARIDEDGYVWYQGRSDDLMNPGGYRVSPAEVERVLHAHPTVAEAVVTETGVKDGVSIITAFVVAATAFNEITLIQHCRKHLADYKCPRRIIQIETLPRTPAGKIMRRELGSLQDSVEGPSQNFRKPQAISS